MATSIAVGHVLLASTLLPLLLCAAAGARPELLLPSDALDNSAALGDERPILQQSIADRVNADERATWKATTRNPRLQGLTVKDVKRLCGALKPSPEPELPVVSRRKSSLPNVELPASFDAREAWPRCASIGAVLDQGHCGSCWAFGAVEALSDRFCIHGFENVTLSENDLLACCGFDCGYGCNGGYPYRAWQYFQRKGVVSDACFPYFDTTGCAHPGCEPVYPTPVCSRTCVSSDDLWAESKHFATTAYYVASDPEELKLELYTNGPIEVSFDVYEDFAHYESGVYQYTAGEYLGGHAVKFIGWGTTEDGVDFWTVVNSWNTGWGDNGLFKIVRGTNDCDIETGATAGLPYLRKSSDM